MAKPNPYLDKMLKGSEKVIDPNALSLPELAPLFHCKRGTMGILANQKVQAGEWERVWKMGTRWLIPAYRPKK